MTDMGDTEATRPDREPNEPTADPSTAWGAWNRPRRTSSKLLDNRYGLEEEIGEGASSITYRGLDLRLGRRVAIKILREQYALDRTFMRRFEREARAAASVSHPHVVHVHDVGQLADRPYIVMDYIDGETLKEWLAREGPLPQAEAVRIAREVLAGLAAIHRAGIIHRDIKPQNILIDRDGTARLADFGIAHVGEDTGLTTTGTTLGTASYMAPEQAQGGQLVPATDLYAVGVVLYEMLTGRLPFEAPSTIALIYAHLQTQPVPPSRRVPGIAISPALDRLVMRALAKRPDDRFADAGEMDRALTAAVMDAGDEGMETQPIGVVRTTPSTSTWRAGGNASRTARDWDHTVDRLSRRYGHRRVAAWGLVLLALLLLGGGVAGALLIGRDPGGDEPTPTARVAAEAPAAQDERLALSSSGTPGAPTVTPEPTRTPAPTETKTPLPTETPLPTSTPTPTETPLPTSTSEPAATSAPTEAPAPTVAPTEPSAPIVPGDPEEGDGSSVDGADGGEIVVTDESGESQVIVPIDETETPAEQDSQAGTPERLEVAFSAWDWRGAYFQETGNVQPWSALYAQSTGYGQGSLTFTLPGEPASDTFVLVVEGMTSENWPTLPITIQVNGQVVYDGSSPFPTWNGVDGEQPWTVVRFDLPTEPLQPGENTVTIVNMVGEGAFSRPPYILLAGGTLTVDAYQ